jgi:hypothetical protein
MSSEDPVIPPLDLELPAYLDLVSDHLPVAASMPIL